MNGLSFHRRSTISESAPERMDIACFLGMITARASRPLTAEIAAWMVAHSWATSDEVAAQPASAFKKRPIPIENWAVFDGLFQWESRTADGLGGPTYLGIAVRSFFSQGGQKCYVVPIAESMTMEETGAQQKALRDAYLPGGISEQDRTTWKNAGVLFGLEDVSLVVLPDLPELVRELDLPPPLAPPPEPPVEEHFVRCDDTPAPPPPPDTSLASENAPRCNQDGYTEWSKFLAKFRESFLGTRVLREAQLIAAMPLPADASTFGTARDLIRLLPPDLDFSTGGGFVNGFIQVCYPWVKTDDSLALPEQLLPPDGLTAGLLARNALTRGTFLDATKIIPNKLFEVYPQLGKENYTVPEAPINLGGGITRSPLVLAQRLSLFGPTPAGFRLVSDVTASLDPSYRSAPTRRLISALVRTARRVGEGLMFGASGPRLWGRLQSALSAALTRYWQAGALDGETASKAFSVRCDRTTILQNDLDNGRVVAEVTLNTAVSLEQIRVLLTLDSGDVALQLGADDAALEVA
jgi:Bacteriophage tail sheath protein